MTWKDYQLKIQLAKTPKEFQNALAESLLALLKLEDFREKHRRRQSSLKKDPEVIVWKWLSERVKFAKKK